MPCIIYPYLPADNIRTTSKEKENHSLLQVLKMSEDHKVDKIVNFDADEDIVQTGTPSKVNSRSLKAGSRNPKLKTRTKLDHYLSVFKYEF